MTCFAVGAYVFAISAVHVHRLVAIGAAIGATAFVYLAVARVCQAADNDTYALAMLAVHLAIIGVITNMREVTGGAHGLRQIVAIFDRRSAEVLGLAILVIGILTATVYLLRSSRGLTLYAVGDDLAWSESLGIPSGRILLIAAFCSGAVVGLAGALYAAHSQYISPDRFTVLEAISVAGVAMMFPRKPLVTVAFAACALVLIPEMLRFLPWTAATGANARRMVFCAFLMLSALRINVQR